MMIDAGQVAVALAALGVACDVSVAQDGTVTLHLPDGATDQQRAAAAQALASLDMRPRRRRSVDAILADLNALSAGARLALVVKWLAAAAADNPRMLRRLGASIDGDEPDA